MSAETREQTIFWRVHPARERPVALVVALAVIAAFAWLAAEWMEMWGWGLFAAALMIAMLHRFFFPSEYKLDSEGVEARHALTRQRLRWNEIRRFVHDAHGAHLSSRARPSTLDAFRGVHLLFDANGQAAVERIRRGLARIPHHADQSAGDRPHQSDAPARANAPHPEATGHQPAASARVTGPDSSHARRAGDPDDGGAVSPEDGPT